MEAKDTTLNVLIITSGVDAIAVDAQEIERLIPDTEAGENEKALVEEHRSRKTLFSLEDLTGRTETHGSRAALVVKAGPKATRLVVFAGETEERTVRTADIIPVSEFLRRKQNPFVIWGFLEEADSPGTRAVMLATFQFLQEKGSA